MLSLSSTGCGTSSPITTCMVAAATCKPSLGYCSDCCKLVYIGALHAASCHTMRQNAAQEPHDIQTERLLRKLCCKAYMICMCLLGGSTAERHRVLGLPCPTVQAQRHPADIRKDNPTAVQSSTASCNQTPASKCPAVPEPEQNPSHLQDEVKGEHLQALVGLDALRPSSLPVLQVPAATVDMMVQLSTYSL